MKITSTRLPAVKHIVPRRFVDARGWFMETYTQKAFHDAEISVDFVQTNQSFSTHKGTVRGLHNQKAPFAQGKLIQVLSGRIFDVAVDLDPDSATFGEHVSVELDASNGAMLYIPPTFAHGFCTLTPDTRVTYACTHLYAPHAERGIFWNDPDLAIAWPVEPENAIVSEKDQQLPAWKAVKALLVTEIDKAFLLQP
jgi:dTDP-4-dehydrorhamnose 3,5-epimerase